MSIEIDQSGKVEQLSTNTVVALANDYSCAILITTSSKRRLFIKLRGSKVPRNVLYPWIFSILIFLALKQLKTFPNTLIIDEEYTGKDKIIKDSLLKLTLKIKPKWNGEIRFKQVGKLSPSHKLAWSVHNKTSKVKFLKTNEIEIMRYLI